ncbi:MAG: glycerophosphodiester phosphodiesterase family protein [Armatimonadota bacterium]|nr:glycerophosphodiester phosphodiesterase family protein [Armatimonadota bacterium]
MRGSFRHAVEARRFLRMAHRGASAYAPENTIPAFELACAQGADALELDVRLTRDGEVVVIHDARVDRTTDGRGDVAEMTWRELQTLDAGVRFGDAFRGTRIPRLREVLERFAGRALLDVEIKGGITAGWLGGTVTEDPSVSVPLAQRVLTLAEGAGALDRVMISGFGAAVLAWVREACPQVPTQWSVLAPDIGKDCAYAARAGFDVISPQIYAATEANVAAAHSHGLAVYIYTAGVDAAMGRLIALGVDALKTDRPDLLSALMAGRRET